MKPPPSDITNYYARRASEYEKIYERAERQNDLCQLKDRISEEFVGATVLEIACGTGYWSQFIARRASAILATDFNSEVLEIASQKDYGDCDVEFRLADAYALADVPSGFGAGFAGFWWSHVPLGKLAGFLSVFHSKLEKDAKVLFLDNAYVEGSNTPISRRDDEGNTYQVRELSDGSRHEVLKNFPSDQDLRRELSPFSSKVEIERLSYFWVAEYSLD
jgi:SAM-dependent methyltransferase